MQFRADWLSSGTAELDGPPLCSHLTQHPCLYYKWRIEERWSCLTTEDGKLERDSGWEKVAGGEQMISFRLKDDQGEILIHPQGAKIEPVVLLDKICDRNDLSTTAKARLKESATASTNGDSMRAAPVHDKLYVVGNARKTAAGGASEIAEDSHAPMFLISARTEDEVRKRTHGGMVKWMFGGLAVLIAGLLARDFQTLQVVSESWPVYLVFICGYLLVAMWTWKLIVRSGLSHLGPRRTIEY